MAKRKKHYNGGYRNDPRGNIHERNDSPTIADREQSYGPRQAENMAAPSRRSNHPRPEHTSVRYAHTRPRHALTRSSPQSFAPQKKRQRDNEYFGNYAESSRHESQDSEYLETALEGSNPKGTKQSSELLDYKSLLHEMLQPGSLPSNQAGPGENTSSKDSRQNQVPAEKKLDHKIGRVLQTTDAWIRDALSVRDAGIQEGLDVRDARIQEALNTRDTQIRHALNTRDAQIHRDLYEKAVHVQEELDISNARLASLRAMQEKQRQEISDRARIEKSHTIMLLQGQSNQNSRFATLQNQVTELMKDLLSRQTASLSSLQIHVLKLRN
jgi:hypothetical protein